MLVGVRVAVIARLVSTSPDRVREMIHRFDDLGMQSLDPQWAGGRPRQITTDDEAFIVTTANTQPEKLGCPFTRWSIRKLVAYVGDNGDRVVKIGRERCRQISPITTSRSNGPGHGRSPTIPTATPNSTGSNTS